MKLAFCIIISSSFAFAMNNSQNMSRETLEIAYNAAQLIIAQQQQTMADLQRTINDQQMAFDLIWKLNYGTQLERLGARRDLEKAINMMYLLKYSKPL